jgi:hypothetical protein
MIPPALNKMVIPPGRLHHTGEHLRPDEVQRLLEAAPAPAYHATRTCCTTPAATTWPTAAPTPG